MSVGNAPTLSDVFPELAETLPKECSESLEVINAALVYAQGGPNARLRWESVRNNATVLKFLPAELLENLAIREAQSLELIGLAGKGSLEEVTQEMGKEQVWVNACDDDGFSALVYAAHRGNLELVQVLWEQSSVQNRSMASLAACKAGQTEVMQALVEMGAAITFRHLMQAAGHNQTTTADWLLERLPQDQREGTAQLVLYHGAQQGSLSGVRWALGHLPNVDIADLDQFTALMFAASKGQLEVVRYLLEKGADVNKRCNKGWSLLDYAAYGDSVATLRCVLDLWMQVNNVESLFGNEVVQKAFGFAASRGSVGCLEMLHRNGVNPNSSGKAKVNPFLTAVAKGQAEAVAFFLEWNIGQDQLDKASGKVPQGNLEILALLAPIVPQDALDKGLIEAARNGHTRVAASLLKKGASASAVSGKGNPALNLAAREGHGGIVQQLIAAGADVNALNLHEETALMAAANSGGVQTVQLLLANGALADKVSQQGHTAISIAKKCEHNEVVSLLENHQLQKKPEEPPKTPQPAPWNWQKPAVAILLLAIVLIGANKLWKAGAGAQAIPLATQ